MSKYTTNRAAAGWLALFAAGALQASPRIPVRDDEVLTTVRSSLTPSEAEAVRQLRQNKMGATRDQLPAALSLARNLIRLARAEADPRYLSQARAVLAPWWNQPDAPVETILLRATIRQSQHDFDGALTDLAEVIRRDPQNGQAWLTRAVVLTVRGAYAPAREACLQAMRFSDPLAATTATAALGGMTGSAEKAYRLLERALADADKARENLNDDQRAVRGWAMITLGELAEQCGLPVEAERHYTAARALEPRDPTLLAVWANLLLHLRRPAEMAQALGEFKAIDALLLRLAEAEQQWQTIEPGRSTDFDRHVGMLRERFAAARLRGDELHLREEARFELRIERNATRALGLARRNWETQKERADAQVLLEAAEATGDQEIVAAMRNIVTTGTTRAAANAKDSQP